MSTIDEVKARLDIVETVAAYVPTLKKSGRSYKALCPFHTERTPSFNVDPGRGTWHCFGACSTGGDVIEFVRRIEGFDFKEALRVCAERAGVELRPPSARDRDISNRPADCARIVRFTAAGTYPEAVAVGSRRLGNDVHNTMHGVSAPHSGSRPTHNLDLLDLAEVQRQQIPGDEAEEIEIYRPPIDQHQLRCVERTGRRSRPVYNRARSRDQLPGDMRSGRRPVRQPSRR